MRFKWLTTIAMPFVFLFFMGCEGPEGQKGEQGEAGPQGPGVPEYTYLGDDANTCNHCHGENVSMWMGTGHHEAYDALAAIGQNEDPYCLQCHTTGWDSEVTYEGDEPIITPGPDLYGFDDYWPPETAEDSMRIEALKNVQCESCHGSMGPTIYDHSPTLNWTTRLISGEESSMCAKCHEQVEEWHESGHGSVLETHDMTIEEFNEEWNAFSSCWECHTAEGFASLYDGYWAAEGRPEEAHLIGCQTCHDPHDATNDHQLRSLDDYSVNYNLEYAATFSGYETAQICVQCHHARRDNENVLGQIEEGYEHFGPHPSPQMDMYLGSGSYEIEGYDYDRLHAHQNIEEACVTCHMEMRDHDDPLGWKGGHDFEASAATCTETAGCHTATMPDFDYSGVVTRLQWCGH